MDYLPLFLDLRGRDCAVVGGDATAARKAELLLGAGGRVRVFAHTLDEALSRLSGSGALTHVAAPIDAGALAGCHLVVVAHRDEAEAERVAALAAARGIPVNVVDRPRLCTCIMPAIVDRSPLVLAVSTGSAAPVLGRLLRARLEALLPGRLGRLAEMARGLRPEVVAALPPARRRGFWESVLQGPIAELVFEGRDEDALDAMRARLAAADTACRGEIYLVSTPARGDPERLTLRALRLLQQADVVVHDPGLPRPLLDLIRRDAARRTADPRAEVEAIASSLAALAREGRRAAWLTGAGVLRPSGGAAVRDRLAALGANVVDAD